MNTYCHSSGPGIRELKLKLPGSHYHTGDRIEIEIPARSVLTASFLVFILPLLLSIGTYFIVMSFTDKTGYGLLGFFGCFILAEFLVAGIDRIFGRGRYFEPRINRRLPPETKTKT
jgi:positive regulator of sigma E activity